MGDVLRFGGDVALVHEYAGPLAALGLVAGDGVGVFYLQGVVVGVLAHGFEALALGGQVGVVGEDGLVEAALLLVGEGWALALERGEHHAALHFFVVVGEIKRGVGEAEAILLVLVAEMSDFGHVAVGDEAGLRSRALQPLPKPLPVRAACGTLPPLPLQGGGECSCG